MKKQTQEQRQLSKFMSLVLRHKPEKFGLILNGEGFVPIESLLEAIKKEPRWSHITIKHIEETAATCEKQRYELQDGAIRARYGHSAKEIAYSASLPPDTLYHGSNQKALHSILQSGIKKMGRNYVHLSETQHFATLAGQRRGELVILKVNAKLASSLGVQFYYAGNEVWLSTDIPKECIEEAVDGVN